MKTRIDLSVATLGELSTVAIAPLAEGANAWVSDQSDYWTLEKNSGAAVGPDTIAPLPGAPSAGATNARWLRGSGSGGGSANALAGVIYRQGAVNPIAPIYGSFAEAVAAAQATRGPTTLVVDGSLGTPVTTPGTYNLDNITLAGTIDSTAFTELNLVPGTIFESLARITGTLQLRSFATAPVFSTPGTGVTAVLFLEESSALLVDATATAPLIRCSANDELIIYTSDLAVIQSFAAGIGVIDVDASASVCQIEMIGDATLASNALSGAAGPTFVKIISPSAVASTTQLSGPLTFAPVFGSVGSSIIAYTPAVPANYVTPPTQVAAALDDLAATHPMAFSAASSLLTAVAQNVPISALLTSSADLGNGWLQIRGGFVSQFALSYVGAAGNVGGQTITATLFKNGVAVTGATFAGLATTGGVKSHSVTFTPVAFVLGDIFTVQILPSAPLTTALTNVMGAAG